MQLSLPMKSVPITTKVVS